MTNKRIVLLIIAISVFALANLSQAQYKNSVYSMFGVGQIIDDGFGINRSLGGTGIAFKSGRSINYLNPASYLGILPNSFIGEVGVYGIYNTSADNNTFQTDADVNFSNFSASLYLINWWSFSFGLTPFSFVNYEINTMSEIEGEPTSFKKEFKGSGGLNRIYFGNSFKIYRGLAIGFNTAYIFGPITQTESALSNDDFTGYELTTKRMAHSFYFDYGLQYSVGNEKWLYTIGLIYGKNTKINSTDEFEFIYNGIANSLEKNDPSDIKIPQKFGIGIGANKSNKFRAAIDYEWKNWSSINSANPDIDLKNSNRCSIGMEYTPGRTDKSLLYRLGAHYKNSYLEINNTQINSKGINFGVGIPYNGTNILNLSIEYGEEGTFSKGLIKNSYWMFSLSLSLHEFWSNESR